MNAKKGNYEPLYVQMEGELAETKKDATDFQQEAERSIPIIRKYLQNIKTQITATGFSSAEEEIHFFRYVKPRFYSRLIYFHKALQIKFRMPVAGDKAVLKYLYAQQDKLDYFFKKYNYFYLYCRSGTSSLDHTFFKRGQLELLPGITFYGIDTDPSFTTGYDFIVAKMLANELLQHFLTSELEKFGQGSPSIRLSQTTTQLSWTASKVSLIELIYGLQSTGVFNNGRAALTDIAQFIESAFQMKLGNYYRIFQEIRVRKKSRTHFLDEMKEQLIKKMDFTDENPHIR